MLLVRVTGRVVPAVTTPGLEGVPLLLVQPLDERTLPSGASLVCADATRTAGEGDLVTYEGGREAALALVPSFVPVDAAIVAIVDRVDLEPADSTEGGEA